MSDAPLVNMENISKQFGSVRALDSVSFSAWAGEIHVILGENGAGKSSLMNVLAGLYHPDGGELRVEGRPVQIRTPADARKLGIAMVPQHVELIPSLAVWENVILGQEGPTWLLRPRHAAETVRQLIERYRLGLNPNVLVERLSAGEQQKVEILKALYRGTRILILDEPTTFLTPQESDALFQTLETLVAERYAVLVVTHKLRDALKFGRRLTVMRAGRVVAAMETGAVREEQLVQWLMGSDLETSHRMMVAPPISPLPSGAPILFEVSGLATAGTDRIRLHDINLQIRAGEVHGIAGVAGNGQREMAETFVGVLSAAKGTIRLDGKNLSMLTVGDRQRSGLCVIPEDRIHDGTVPSMSLSENVVLGQHRELFPRWKYSPQLARGLARQVIAEYEIKAPSPEVRVAYLSGGNMQKVIVARTVAQAKRHSPAVVIAANPTRGLDVRSVRQVLDQLRSIASRGSGVLLISEDLDELMGECHTISVMRQGTLVRTFEGPNYDRYAIGDFMLGGANGR